MKFVVHGPKLAMRLYMCFSPRSLLVSRQVLLNVARCCTPSAARGSKPPAGSLRGKTGLSSSAGRVLFGTNDMIRVMGDVLETVELLGGGNVVAVTNEPVLAAALEVRTTKPTAAGFQPSFVE